MTSGNSPNSPETCGEALLPFTVLMRAGPLPWLANGLIHGARAERNFLSNSTYGF